MTELEGVFPSSAQAVSFGRAPAASGSVSDSHLHEPPDRDRAEGPEDDRGAELMERWYGWGEDWDAA